MARGLNKVFLIGNCTKDPDAKFMPDGKAVTNIGLATNEEWKNKAGEKQSRVEFHNLTFYGKLAEIAGQYLVKGAPIFVEGAIRTEKWQDKEGKDRYTTKIIVSEMTMLGRGKEGAEEPKEGVAADAGPVDDPFDDIPF